MSHELIWDALHADEWECHVVVIDFASLSAILFSTLRTLT